MTEPQTAPPILFLPGTTGHGAFWDPVRKDLRNQNSTALSWPGLGGNPRAEGVESFDDLVNWTISKITEPSVLIGQSMGGYVAMRVALQRPDLVTHLVMAVTSAGVDRHRLGLPEWTIEANDDDSGWVAEHQQPLDEQIPSVAVPVLLIWATQDPISPLPLAHRLKELLPSAELVTFDSDDHWVVLGHAEEVADLIDRLTA